MHAAKLPALPAMEVPPPVGIGDTPQGPVRGPGGLERGAARAPRDSGRSAGHPDSVELGQPERRTVPRHVRLVPREPREVPSVRARGGRGIEVMAGGEHRLGAVVHRDRDQLVDRRRIPAVRLAHGEESSPSRVEGQVPEPGRARRGEGSRRPGVRLRVDPPVRVVREPEPVPGQGMRAAAVLVHAGPHVERGRSEVLDPPRSIGSNEHVAPPFPGAALEPGDAAPVQADRREPDRLGNDGVGSDRGRPGSEGECLHASSLLVSRLRRRLKGGPAAPRLRPPPGKSGSGSVIRSQSAPGSETADGASTR